MGIWFYRLGANPIRFSSAEQERTVTHPENGDRSMSDRSRFHTLREACDIERFAPERRGLSYTCARPTRVFRLLILFLRGSGRGCPLLRASNEHILIVRVLRARRAPGHSLLILLLQSAVEGVPREALKREGARSLCPDW
jgi:hypothetical protein